MENQGKRQNQIDGDEKITVVAFFILLIVFLITIILSPTPGKL
jgi:hypothetical protein